MLGVPARSCHHLHQSREWYLQCHQMLAAIDLPVKWQTAPNIETVPIYIERSSSGF